MLNNIMIGKYYSVKSRIHLMNPLSKIICTFIFILTLFLTTTLRMSIVLCMLVFLLMKMTKVPIKIYFRTLKSIKFILLLLLVINIMMGIDIETTIVMIIRLCLLVLYTSMLTLTTPPTEITYGLELFLAPLKLFKVPVNRMALSLSLALRFIPTIIDQGNKILKAQASRGVDYYNSKISGKFEAVRAMLFPMFILTIKRADELADAMTVRLYNINEKRTNFRLNIWGLFDTYMVMMHILLIIIVIVGEVV